jgi:hypothetical protein
MKTSANKPHNASPAPKGTPRHFWKPGFSVQKSSERDRSLTGTPTAWMSVTLAW